MRLHFNGGPFHIAVAIIVVGPLCAISDSKLCRDHESEK